ncbi:MAG TPA: hypothetical protein GXZ65_00760 [Clostridiales bacterium]|jgi:phosphoglycolate phosphatase-like HAD superfamily hydrolase|nr:hypothetical protein [Clostridiales bacterium]
MIKRVIRQGLVKYEKEESDLRQEALLEIARIELEEKDAEKRSERISAVLDGVDRAARALRQRDIN